MKLKLIHANPQLKLKFKNDLDRPVITENCLERNWEEIPPEEDDFEFNFYWIAVTKMKNLFNPRLRV